MKKNEFYFDLPKEFIAQTPLKDRSNSKLMKLNKISGEIEHKIFKDILSYLKKGDLIVLNDTRVLPARIFGKKETGAKVEFLLLRNLGDNRWLTLVKPGKKAKIGVKFIFGDGILEGVIVDHAEEGARIIEFTYDGIFEEVLDKIGTMPLPPYIVEELKDQERYQTVYSKYNGSAAAPTAGLHFTPELIDQIIDMGVEIAYVTLHVGLGTFRPVKADNILDHQMHSEYYEISEETAEKVNKAKLGGGRIISVGTTSTRTLESAVNEDGFVSKSSGWTEIFIYPGYKFKIIDGLITNFHLPESTLIMLVSALAGKDNVLNAYEEAIKNNYRFFSFGDAMLVI
ncbi:tRNA preQ1(34) S-adenosylmethionine ribosyltransferase-isomerase QueA [Helicovermis profundi]|uniref:S-adenosylmethionine:tRNA ribosyltransferase-isomerase n=1 Tax=Helicovermis profundi TaxID=3065157 RepID=A0AAU9EM27_9FIRM|nr:tRNA preQ1(34) S-adenosylmethionine ribosyltransferase-isomerase QueA [Clostridia bacterium S502]